MARVFSSWRRIFGIGTLSLACLMMMGWMRSMSTSDYVRVFPVQFQGFLLISTQQKIWLQVWQGKSVSDDSAQERRHMKRRIRDSPERLGIHLNDQLFRDAPMGTGTVNIFQPETRWFDSTYDIGIPYWSITAPLICVSMWLLFSTPVASKKNASVEDSLISRTKS